MTVILGQLIEVVEWCPMGAVETPLKVRKPAGVPTLKIMVSPGVQQAIDILLHGGKIPRSEELGAQSQGQLSGELAGEVLQLGLPPLQAFGLLRTVIGIET